MVIPVTAMDDNVVEVRGCKVGSVKQDVHHSLECCWGTLDVTRKRRTLQENTSRRSDKTRRGEMYGQQWRELGSCWTSGQ